MAFVAPFTGTPLRLSSRVAVSTRATPVRVARQPRMSLAPLSQNVSAKVLETAQLIATKDGDFGGYTGPIIGLLIIGIIIAVLTPPIKE